MWCIYPSHTTLALIYKWLHHLKPHYEQTALSVQERSCFFFPTPSTEHCTPCLLLTNKRKQHPSTYRDSKEKKCKQAQWRYSRPATHISHSARHLHLPPTSYKMHSTLVELRLLVRSSCSRLESLFGIPIQLLFLSPLSEHLHRQWGIHSSVHGEILESV